MVMMSYGAGYQVFPVGSIRTGTFADESRTRANLKQAQCRNSAVRRMVLLVEGVFLRPVARKWITKAANAPIELPKTANSTLWVVYENANPAMLIAWREP